MEVRSIQIVETPGDSGSLRLTAEVAYDAPGVTPEWYWFQTSRDQADLFDRSGNPWLAILLPLAVSLGEPLKVLAPVDRGLLSNAYRLMEIWKRWYPQLRPVPVSVDGVLDVSPPEKRVGAFFSGGVDSFFTVLQAEETLNGRRKVIDELVFVEGFDIPLRHPESLRILGERLKGAAKELQKKFVVVRTNLRETKWKQTAWGELSHGAAIAGVALALNRFGTVLIASTNRLDQLLPRGSHPLTDPLFSTARTQIVHHGAEFSRVEKTRFLSTSDVALRHLHVCYRQQSHDNCGRCEKCYRTMLTLELLGALSRCSVFPSRSVNVRAVSRIYSSGSAAQQLMEEIVELASETGRSDIATRLTQAIRRSRRLDRVLRKVGWLERNPFVWRVGRGLRRAIEGSSFR